MFVVNEMTYLLKASSLGSQIASGEEIQSSPDS